jgi:hypothetical protein
MIPSDRAISETRPQERYTLSNADEKRVQKLAERKGFHLEKAGHGKSHGRFYIMDVAEGARMRSGVAEHEYSFLLEEAEAWLSAYSK